MNPPARAAEGSSGDTGALVQAVVLHAARAALLRGIERLLLAGSGTSAFLERGQDGPPVALLAREEGPGLVYAGGAAVTLAGADRERFWRSVERLETGSAMAGAPGGSKGQWLRPQLRARARYLKGSGKLRHATAISLL